VTNDFAKRLSAEEVRTFEAELKARRRLGRCNPSHPSYHRFQSEWVDAVLAWRGAVARAHSAACAQYGVPHLHRVG
jgi:hypothetical protein